jgi:hypothetical protein
VQKILTLAFWLAAYGCFGQLPAITDFQPASGPVGTAVIITGTHFSPDPGQNLVFFGAVRANVTAAAVTQLSVQVPAGATAGPVSVQVGGLTAHSARSFAVTFDGSGVITAGAFAEPAYFYTGSYPYRHTLADLDGDGRLDVVAANNGGTTLSLLRNTSTPGSVTAGFFATQVNIPAGDQPYAVAAGDLDGDGKPELAVANVSSPTVLVFKNASTPGTINPGSFAAGVAFPTGQGPSGIVIRDLDADGKPEMLVVNYTARTISVLRNTSPRGRITAASFAPKVDYPVGATPVDVAVDDLDGDGRPDLAIANGSSSTVSVFRNTVSFPGDFTAASFARQADLAAGGTTVAVAIGDLDGDGKPEVVAADAANGNVCVWRNTGSAGSLTAASFAGRADWSTGPGPAPASVAIGDLDGDGKADLATANDYKITVFRNTGLTEDDPGLSFRSSTDFLLDSGAGAVDVLPGDVDGDGKADLVTLNYMHMRGSVAVLRNTNLPVPPPTITSFTPAAGPFGRLVVITGTHFNTIPAHNKVTFNGTVATVMASTPTQLTVSVPFPATSGKIAVTVNGKHTATTQAGFTVVPPPVVAGFSPAAGPVGSLVTIEGNRFGATPEANVVRFGGVRATVVEATPTRLRVEVPAGAGYRPISVAVGELVTASSQPFVPTFGSSGPFTAASLAKVNALVPGSYANYLAAGDLDGDAKADLILSEGVSPDIFVYRNTSSPDSLVPISFAPRQGFDAGGRGPSSIAIGDLDGDGKPDVALATSGSEAVTVLRNTTTGPGPFTAGSFAPRVRLPVEDSPYDVAITDVDGDGKPDLVVGNARNSVSIVSVLRNVSTPGTLTPASFAPPVHYHVIPGVGIKRLLVSDVDGDNKPDVLVAFPGRQKPFMLRNKSIPGIIAQESFEPVMEMNTGAGVGWYFDMVLGDFDGDQKPDLAVSNGDQTIVVHKNTASPGNRHQQCLRAASQLSHGLGQRPAGHRRPDRRRPAGPGGKRVRSFHSPSVVLASSPATGAITAGSFAPRVQFKVEDEPDQIIISDLDADGRPEVISVADEIAILRNQYQAPPPVMSGFSPAGGPPETVVVITGTDFSPVPGYNKVTFNGRAATMTASTPTRITAVVPAGATTGPISVTFQGQTARSAADFIVPVAQTIAFR